MMIKPEERDEEIVTFVDNGFSGGNIDRDGFCRMMKQVEEGRISKIIVYRLDRISRSLSDFVHILNILKKHGVRFVSSQESFDTSTPYGEMIVKILIVFAEFERQSIIERVTQAYSHRSELGIYMGGRRPYGFETVETEIHGIKTKMLDPVEHEIEHIRYIYENYAAEGVTLRGLMDELIENGMMPSDGSWSAAKLSAIMKNPIYVRADNAVYEYYASQNCRIVSDISAFDGLHGVQLYGKAKHEADDMSDMKIVVMLHEGIISSDVWLMCQKKLEKNRQIGNSASNSTSWLGGKVFCRKCGRIMRAVKGSRRKDGSVTRYFGCTGKSLNRICPGPDVPVYAASLEDAVYTLIGEKLSSLKEVGYRERRAPDEHLNRMKNRLSEIGIEEDRLVERMMNSALEDDMINLLNGRAKKLREERRVICEKIAESEGMREENESVIDLTEKWRSASYEEKKAAAGLLIHKIYIGADGDTEVVWNV